MAVTFIKQFHTLDRALEGGMMNNRLTENPLIEYVDRDGGSGQDDFVTVQGRRFHYTWLRDCCQCTSWLNRETGERLSDLGLLPAIPAPRSVHLGEDRLTIEWDETPLHRCVFDTDWLLAHAYDGPIQPRWTADGLNLQLWNAADLDRDPPTNIAASEPFETWFAPLYSRGFVVLERLAADALESFIAQVGPLLPTGPVSPRTLWDVVAGEATVNDLLFSEFISADAGLRPHTDLPASTPTDFVQFLCCKENSTPGGEAIVVDGFRVAKDFAAQYPEHFAVLTSTPVTYHALFTAQQAHYQVRRPVVELDESGALTAIRFNPHRRGPLCAPFDKTDALLRAHAVFVTFINDPRYHHRFRYRPGDCLLTQNFRVLHGRESFTAGMGKRHLIAAYCQWSHFDARWRYLQSRAAS